jgi:hypothetical protein
LFTTKRSPLKTTRQTLRAEQLEPKAIFSVSPVESVNDSRIKMLKGELMKAKKLLSCSDRNRAILQQRLDDTKQRCSSLQSSYESLVKQHHDLQLAHQALASKSLVLAKQWQLLRDQKAQAAPM